MYWMWRAFHPVEHGTGPLHRVLLRRLPRRTHRELTETQPMSETTNDNDNDRAKDLVDVVLTYLGPRDVARILRDGDPEAGVEPVTRSDVLGALSPDPENGITRVTIENVVRNDDDCFNGVRRLVTSWAEQSIGERNPSSPGAFARIVAYEVEELPAWLGEEIVREQVHYAQNVPYDHPEDFARELVLRQLLAEEYGVENVDTRRRLWDEMLKFTLYEVEIAFDLWMEEGQQMATATKSRRMWHTSSAKAHNFYLSELRRRNDAELDGGANDLTVIHADAYPVKRYYPEFDAMDDLEDFVWGLE
ncbi:hypothetical protein HRTV-11_gp99 [Halorubrum virus HRTV-11]|nr:hypothetical protein HRTV-11_gp99 [Halorubrum virus HRTV-11]